MSQTTAKSQPSENDEPTTATEKSAMPSPGTKSVPLKNRSPMGQTARSSNQGESNPTEDGQTTIKPQSARIPVARTPGKSSVSPHKRPASSLPPGSTLRPENQYAMKKKRYQLIKKELTDKQKVAQELYNDMSQLREKMIANGKDPGKPEALKIEIGIPKQFQPTDIPVHTEPVDLQLEKLTIGKELLDSLGDRLRAIPKKSRRLCQELLDKQADFVAFVTSQLINASREGSDSGMLDHQVTKQLEAHQKDHDALRSRLNEVDETEEEAIAQLTRSVQHLIDEYERSRLKIMEMNAAEAQKELQMQLHAAVEELRAERDKSKDGKERLRQAETQLQKTRAKIRELEASMANDKEKILSLQNSLKNLEGQMKQKELAVDAKFKDMQKALKNSEDLVSKVEKQRDTFEARLIELKEKMTIKENEAMGTIKELSERLNAVTADVGVEREKRLQAEEEFNDLQERYKSLETKSQQLCELAEKNKDFTITGSHTENEMRLFNELQETREELERQRQEVLQLQQEKEEIVAVMHQAASREEDDDSREKLAAELVFKTNELQNLVMEHAELKKVAKNAQEKNGILERQLIEIQNRLHSQSMEGGKAGLSAHAIELQQEVSDLRNNLTEVIQQKEELETALTQKQLELEQRDRVMREQSKFLKVRDEMLDILKGKVQQQENGELSNSDANNEYLEQIAAKTEAIQGLYTTLENKQLQIMRLEKMVKLMEDHQDRAQAQRTRLENRIAQLELALQRNKEQRYVREKSSSSLKFRANNERDRLSPDYYSDSDQPNFKFQSFSYPRNHNEPINKRSDFVCGTVGPSKIGYQRDYAYYTPRQTSSDDEQPYICERCRQETTAQKDDQCWLNKKDSTDNTNESFNWLTNESSQDITQEPGNIRDFQNDDYTRDSPPLVRDRRYSSAMYNVHGESDNMDDSSRESQNPYQRNYHQHRHPFHHYYHHRVRPSLPARTGPHEITL